jgi:prepilin-type N-terminal cleavage/methylation domain-containing protein
MTTRPRSGPEVSSGRSAFTLIELLVAMALMTILTGSVVFIFMQSQKIFLTVDARVQVYQYARYAFDQMERDLANVIRSSDMEFYDDIPSLPGGRIGRFDQGEEIPIRRAEDSDAFYNHALTLRQPRLYTGVNDQVQYRHDSIYFKTVTVAGNTTAAALVEYAMVDVDRERPKLVKKTWRVTGIDTTNPTRLRYQINDSRGDQAQPIVQDLCLYTVEARFELFLRNKRRGTTGEYYSCEQMITPPTPNAPFEAYKNDAVLPGDLSVATYYHPGHNVVRTQPDLGILDPSEGGPNKGGLFHTEDYFTFPMLAEGDRIYVWGSGSPREYTIEKFCKADGSAWSPVTDTASELRIKFKEPIDWPTTGGVPTTSQVRVSWDAAYLPPALRATLRIKDGKSFETRSIQRVFKILAN